MDPNNPYAASQYQDLPPEPAPGSGLAWTPTEILSIAWDRFREHWVVLFLAVILAGFLGRFPEWIANFTISVGGMTGSEEALALSYGGIALGWLVDCLLTVGLIRIFLQAARGEQLPEFGALFSGFDRFLPMLVVAFVVQFSIVIGLLFLVIPAVFFGCVFFIADYLMVDQRIGPLRALQTSWELTRGHRMNLVALGALGIVVSLVGLLACGIGLAAAKAVMGVSAALVYLRMIGEHAPGVRVKAQW